MAYRFKKQKTPITVREYKYNNNTELLNEYLIEDISFETEEGHLYVTIEGKKLFDAGVKDGKDNFIEWALKEPDGEIAKGKINTRDLKQGETFCLSMERYLYFEEGEFVFKIPTTQYRDA